MATTKITRYGNSLGVRLPAALVRELELSEGDIVSVERTEGGLLIAPRAQSRLEAMLATVRERDVEWDTGGAVGAEIIE